MKVAFLSLFLLLAFTAKAAVIERLRACCSVESCAQFPSAFGGKGDIQEGINQNSPNTFSGAGYTGEGYEDNMYSDDGYDQHVPVYYFSGSFSDGYPVKVCCDKSAGDYYACEESARIALTVMGRIPLWIRYTVNRIVIRPGKWAVWGGGGTITMNIGFTEEVSDYSEESLFHECAHNTIDPIIYRGQYLEQWNCARDADKMYLTEYGRDFPFREDVADTVVFWNAQRYNLVSADKVNKIRSSVPNRIRLLDDILTKTLFVESNFTDPLAEIREFP